MSRCPQCGGARLQQSADPHGPAWCEDCGDRVEDRSTRPQPISSAKKKAAAAAPREPAPGGLAAWALAKAKKVPAGVVAAKGEVKPAPPVPIRTDYLQFPEGATVGQVLLACQQGSCQGSTLLMTFIEEQYRICTLGSLLPYLLGRTPHIVHRHGECPVCTGLDPLIWRDTTALLQQALADGDVCSRTLPDLPLAAIPMIEAGKLQEAGTAARLAGLGFRACAVTENGLLRGVHIIQQTMTRGGPPDF